MARSTLLILLYTLVYLSSCLYFALTYFNPSAPHSYMDEIFHISQTQSYCRHQFYEWNIKITTFPGLYLTALGYVEAISRLIPIWSGPIPIDEQTRLTRTSGNPHTAPIELLCTPPILRSINIVYGAACIPLIYLILKKLHPGRSVVLSVIQFSLFPLFFFFHFLYYTDCASVFWTLATYLAHLSQWSFVSSTLGFIAVFMRQTNIVWIGFMLLTDLNEKWSAPHRLHGIPDSDQLFQPITIKPFNATGNEKEDKLAATRQLYHPTEWSSFPRTLTYFVFSCLRSAFNIILHYFGLLLICITFITFFVLNGYSIVVGDKTNHSFSAHLPQLGYFIVFSIGFTSINWFSLEKLRQATINIKRHFLLSFVILIGFGLGVHYFTFAHPFLLSDNRHYTFYLWKNFFGRWSWFKYLMVPIYLICGQLMQLSWSSIMSRSLLFQCIYWLVVSMCLIPTPLLEFRYFLTPFIIWYLHAAPILNQSTTRTILAILLYSCINIVTLYIFLFKPFNWPDGSEARFMW